MYEYMFCSQNRNQENFAGQEKKLSEFTIALLLPNPKLVDEGQLLGV